MELTTGNGSARVVKLDSLPDHLTSGSKVNFSNSICVDVVLGAPALLRLEAQWNAITSSNSNPSPFSSWNWIKNWIEIFGADQNIVTLVCRNGQEVVGIVPFAWKQGIFPLSMRKLCMIASQTIISDKGVTEEPVFAIKSQPQIRDLVLSATHSKLKQMLLSGPWDCIAYRRFGQGIEGCSLVEMKKDCVVTQRYSRGSEFVHVSESWEEYLDSLSKSTNRKISYFRKKFQKANVHLTVEEVLVEEAEAAIETLVSFHNMRVCLGPNCKEVDSFNDPRQVALLIQAMKDMIPVGDARIVVLKANDQIIAVQVFLKSGSMLVAHHSGFDPQWTKFRPVFVLQSYVIQGATREGIKTLSFIRGNTFKQETWGAKSHNQIIDITIAKTSLLPRIRQTIKVPGMKLVGAFSSLLTLMRRKAELHRCRMTKVR